MKSLSNIKTLCRILTCRAQEAGSKAENKPGGIKKGAWGNSRRHQTWHNAIGPVRDLEYYPPLSKATNARFSEGMGRFAFEINHSVCSAENGL